MTVVHHHCAVLGKPISHSLSPVLHMAAYRELGLDDWEYMRQEVDERDLERFLNGLDPSWRGLSLTMPLKRTIQPYGTPQDQWSKRLMVSNTAILNWSQQSKMPSVDLYNTDVNGIVMAFRHAWSECGAVLWSSHCKQQDEKSSNSADFSYSDGNECVQGNETRTTGRDGAHAVILGNGNTALSALAACTQLQIPGIGPVDQVTVCARRPKTGDALEQLALQSEHQLRYRCIPLNDAIPALLRADIVISTLPAHAADDLAVDLLQADRPVGARGRDVPAALLDVVYKPNPSLLLQSWGKLDGYSIGGQEMLLYQALEQVALMTACSSSCMARLEQAMRRALEESI